MLTLFSIGYKEPQGLFNEIYASKETVVYQKPFHVSFDFKLIIIFRYILLSNQTHTPPEM